MNDALRPGAAARRIALELLRGVVRRGRPLDGEIAAHKELFELAPRDRAFARLMVATALRRLGQIDALIDSCMERPLRDSADRARDILRLGTVQLVFLGTPAHAAVDGTVSLVSGKAAPFRRLINAVLRRIAREGKDAAATQDAARLNTPDWLWADWSRRFGEATCRRIAEAHLDDPPLDLTTRESAADWAGRLDGKVIGGTTIRRAPGGGAVADLPGYDSGGWWVQDFAASLPAKLLISALGRGPQAPRVADLCAAPGGKSAQLAAAGFRVVAVDRSPSRLARVTANLSRLGLAAETAAADVLSYRAAAPFDGVLLDAPCTATGTMRRHPDIARLKRPEDPAEMAKLQEKLLAAAAALVAPGGTLVYSVCSLQAVEGKERVDAFLATGAPFARVPVMAEEIGGLDDAVTGDGDLQTLPCHFAECGGMDGFFAARLRRAP